MRRAYVITKPGNVHPKLTASIAALGCPEPSVSEVDLRGANARDLIQDGHISSGAYLALIHGRCSDFGIPSPAGVGCYLSHLQICRQICALPAGSLALVLEADCVLDVPLLEAAISSVEQSITLSHADPHLVLFGSEPLQGCAAGASELCDIMATTSRPIPGTDTELRTTLPGAVSSRTHCCLYTVAGAAFVLRELGSKPVDVQWDSALSVLSVLSTGSRFLWWCPKGASQSLHLSSIQDICVKCMMKGALPAVLFVGLLLLALLLGVLIASRHCYQQPRVCG